MPFAALGYDVVHCGFSQWNGVAIASRIGHRRRRGRLRRSADVDFGRHRGGRRRGRALGATCGGVRVWSLYIPNGRTVDSPHYAYKLEWLAALRHTAHQWLMDDPAHPSPWSGTGTSPPPMTTCGVSRPTRAAPMSRRRNATRSPPSSTPVTPTWCVRSHRVRRLHLLGLHPVGVPETTRYAHRLHPRLAGAGRPRRPCRDRPRGTERQGRQRSRPRSRGARRLSLTRTAGRPACAPARPCRAGCCPAPHGRRGLRSRDRRRAPGRGRPRSRASKRSADLRGQR